MPFRRSLRTVVLTALAALALPASAVAACEGADALPGATDAATIEAATICLLNEERAATGAAPVRGDDALHAAAAAHAADMVERRYFAHESPGGGTLTDRLRTAGWIPSGASWRAGENLAWGTGRLATPREIVDGWMHSAGHRANLLEPAFDEVGLAVVAAAPTVDADVAGTYVADFGARDGAGPSSAREADAPPATAPTRTTPPPSSDPVAPATAPGGKATTKRPAASPRTPRRSANGRRAVPRHRCVQKGAKAAARRCVKVQRSKKHKRSRTLRTFGRFSTAAAVVLSRTSR